MSAAQWAYQYYVNQHGLLPHVAAAIVDNIQVESGFSPSVLSGKLRGDDNTAAFAFQWRGPRLRNFENYARQRGSMGLTTQLDFALEEMNPASPYRDDVAAKNRHNILNAPDRHSSAINFAKYFERPAAKHIPGRPFAAKIDTGNAAMGAMPELAATNFMPNGGAVDGNMGIAAGMGPAMMPEEKGNPMAGLMALAQLHQQNTAPPPPPTPQPEQRRVVEYDQMSPYSDRHRSERERKRRKAY